MSLHKIPDEIVKKYNLDNPGEEKIELAGVNITLPKRPVSKAPFTGYNIVWREDGLYIDIPDGVDEIVPAE